MMAERTLDRCIFCGDCIEVCPHGALGETPNFELSFFNRFGPDVALEKGDLTSGRHEAPLAGELGERLTGTAAVNAQSHCPEAGGTWNPRHSQKEVVS